MNHILTYLVGVLFRQIYWTKASGLADQTQHRPRSGSRYFGKAEPSLECAECGSLGK